MKLAERIKENKIFFLTLILSVSVSAFYLLQKDLPQMMDNFYYPLYVVNYDCGLSSRLLVGSVFSLFSDGALSSVTLIRVMLCIHFLMCLVLSLFINSYLKKTSFEALGIYAAFMVVSPVFLSFLTYLGILDVFWIFCTIGAVTAVSKRGWRWLVPVFCLVGLAVHEVFATTYLPVIAIAVLYQFIKKPSVSGFAFISFCALCVGAAAVYFLFIGDGTMTMTSDEMVSFARNRLDSDAKSFDEYYLRSVFFWETPEVEAYDGFFGYLRYNFKKFNFNDSSALREIMFYTLINMLSAVPFVAVIFSAFRKAERPAEKFIFFCALMPVPLSILHTLFSSDTERFSAHLLLVMLTLLLFFSKENSTAFSQAYSCVEKKIRDNKIILAILGASVAKIVLSGVKF